MVTRLAFLTLFAGLSLLVPIRASAQSPPTKLDPPGPPGPTMKTLDEIPPAWSQILPVEQRFQMVMGGVAVLDRETGLVWERSPSAFAEGNDWSLALLACSDLSLGGRKGWRLPGIAELTSLLVNVAGVYYRLPIGHPFGGSASGLDSYWSATPYADDVTQVFAMSLDPNATGRNVFNGSKNGALDSLKIWCVRGGQGVAPQ
jgi:hypothetical protein